MKWLHIKEKTDFIKTYDIYQHSITGDFSYVVYDGTKQIGEAHTPPLPYSVVTILAEQRQLTSIFKGMSYPGAARAIVDEKTKKPLATLTFMQENQYWFTINNRSMLVKTQPDAYIFWDEQTCIAKMEKLNISHRTLLKDNSKQLEKYFKMSVYQNISDMQLLVMAAFPLLRFWEPIVSPIVTEPTSTGFFEL